MHKWLTRLSFTPRSHFYILKLEKLTLFKYSSWLFCHISYCVTPMLDGCQEVKRDPRFLQFCYQLKCCIYLLESLDSDLNFFRPWIWDFFLCLASFSFSSSLKSKALQRKNIQIMSHGFTNSLVHTWNWEEQTYYLTLTLKEYYPFWYVIFSSNIWI